MVDNICIIIMKNEHASLTRDTQMYKRISNTPSLRVKEFYEQLIL